MSKPVHTIEIDRIILTDLGVTPDRAERIRTLVEVELQLLLEREVLPRGTVGGEISHLHVPTMQLAEHNSDQHLASGVARRIAQGLRAAG